MIMIEKIARAIAGEARSQEWQNHLVAARAAVRAMQEPDLDMLEAALPGLPDWGYLPEEWTTMINFVASQPLENSHDQQRNQWTQMQGRIC